jgi:hypothetical protein
MKAPGVPLWFTSAGHFSATESVKRAQRKT